jgi:hypothetical protein
MRRRQGVLIATVAVIVVLVGIRAALPAIVKNQVNERLQALDDYTGYVQEVDLALWRGEYRLRDLIIERDIEGQELPLLVLPRADLALQWRALFSGRIVGEAELHSPEVILLASELAGDEQSPEDEPWYALLEELTPFQVNHFAVHDGLFRFVDLDPEKDVDVFISHTNGVLTNLSNVQESEADSFASFEIAGLFAGHAPVRSSGELNPLASPPVFEIDFELETVDLVELNPLLYAYAKVLAESGTFSVYAEFASANGLFEGYVKPILEDPEFTSDENDSLLRKFWAAAVDLAARIFENPPEEQVASQIPFTGELDDIEVGIFAAIVKVLENAFIAAISPQLDNSVRLENLGADSQDTAD